VVERADKSKPAGSFGSRRMSRERRAKIRTRRQRRRLALFLTAGALLLLVTGALFVSGDGRSGAVEQLTPPSLGAGTTTGPYDFSQVADDFSLARVAEAKFVSVTLGEGPGTKSFMLTRERPEFAALAAAVAQAEAVGGDQAPPLAEEATHLVFVTTERETVELVLGDEGRFYWRGKAFRPAQDLARLIEEAEYPEGGAG
jgi:hypothetical protein